MTEPSTPSSTVTSTIGDPTVKSIADAVSAITKPFAEVYEKVNYPGYISILGAALAVLPLLSNVVPWLHLDTEGQRLYVYAGITLVIAAGAWICLQNLLVYKIQRASQEVACRMLAIKVAAMGETQKAALEAIGEVKHDDKPVYALKDK